MRNYKQKDGSLRRGVESSSKRIWRMKLYLLTRTDRWSYDDYDSLVVCAESEEDAKDIGPDGPFDPNAPYTSWTRSKDNIICEEIGDAHPSIERGVILASFNAG